MADGTGPAGSPRFAALSTLAPFPLIFAGAALAAGLAPPFPAGLAVFFEAGFNDADFFFDLLAIYGIRVTRGFIFEAQFYNMDKLYPSVKVAKTDFSETAAG